MSQSSGLERMPVSAKTFTSDPLLRCVAVPVVTRDLEGPLEAQLRLWSDDRFFPLLGAQTYRPHLLVMVNSVKSAQAAAAEALFTRYPALAKSFSSMSVQSAELTGDKDLYERSPLARCGKYGSRAGPNFLFQKTMNAASKYGDFTLQVELDCLPIQAGWIDATQDIIDDHKSAWVIGSTYAGVGEVDKPIQAHLNGNALYRTGHPPFQRFLDKIWMPRLIGLAQKVPNLAYDCWWALEQSMANARAANESWTLFQDYGGYFHSDPFVVNLLDKAHRAQAYTKAFDRKAGLGRVPVFLHGPAMPELRQRLLADPNLSVFSALEYLDPHTGPSEVLPPPWRIQLRRRNGTSELSQPDPCPPEVARHRLRMTTAKLLLDPETDLDLTIRLACSSLRPEDADMMHFNRVLRRVTLRRGPSDGAL